MSNNILVHRSKRWGEYHLYTPYHSSITKSHSTRGLVFTTHIALHTNAEFWQLDFMLLGFGFSISRSKR